MARTAVLNGRPKGYRYLLPNFGRWAFILVTFVYLLATTLALFEALQLQSLVKRLAGDDATRARAAMLALRQNADWRASSDRDGGQLVAVEDRLKFAAMTVALDKLKGATENLGHFEGEFQFPTGGAEESAGTVGPDDGFRETVNNLNVALGDLRRTIRATDGVSVAEALARVGVITQELDGYTFERVSSHGDPSQLIDSASGTEAVQQLQNRFDDLVAQLDAIKGEIVTEAQAQSVYDKVEQVQKIAAAFGQLNQTTRGTPRRAIKFTDFGTQAKCESVGSRTDCRSVLEIAVGEPTLYRIPAGAFGHLDPDALTYSAMPANGHGLPQAWPPWLGFDPDLRAFCADPTVHDAKQSVAIRVVATDAFGSTAHGDLTIRVGEASDPETTLSQVNGSAVARVAPECAIDEVYHAQLGHLTGGLGELEAALIAKEPDIGLAKQLSEQIVLIEDAARWLGRLKPQGLSYRGSDGDADGSEALNLFGRQRQALDDTVVALVRILGDYSPALAVGLALRDDPEAQFKGSVLWNDFQALGRFEPVLLPFRGLESSGLPSVGGLRDLVAKFGLHPKGVATLGNEVLTLILVLAIGAIGSLIFMTKRQLGGALQGGGWTVKPDVAFSWYLFRPIFGVVVAFAIYLLYKAGQIALGGGEDDTAFAGINVPILSVMALFAGLLSWQALDMIESRGRAWLGTATRHDQWAAGLDSALRTAGRSLHECADQVGRSVGQIERWIGCRDKITPEMQDRLTTWLKRDRAELFADIEPKDAEDSRPMWASGLKRALTSKGRSLDAKALAEILDEDPGRVSKWLNRELQVSPPMQWRIVEVLGGVRHSELFDADDQEMERWAVGLRRALEKGGFRGADELATRIGTSTARVRAWMELQELVPFATQTEIARVLRVGEGELFTHNKPDASRLRWGARLRDQMRTKKISAVTLAEKCDAELDQVQAWCDLDSAKGRVAPATQDRIAAILDLSPDDIFADSRDADAFRWGVGLKAAAGQLSLSQAQLADELESDVGRIERWMELREAVPPSAQRALAAILKQPATTLFRDSKP